MIRSILTAARTVGAAYVVVAASFLIRELAIAREFGVSDALDAYLIAYVLPAFAISTLAGPFNSAVIPTFIRIRETKGAAAAQDLFSTVLFWSLCLLIAVTVVLALLFPIFEPYLASGFSAAKLAVTRRLFYAVLPAVTIAGVSAIFAAVLNATERFAISALSPAMTPFIVAASVLVASPRYGVVAIVFGILAGATMELLLLGITLRRHGVVPLPKLSRLTDDTRVVLRQYATLALGQTTMSLTLVVDQSMAAMLSQGAVSALSYGNKVANFGVGVVATAIGVAVMPYFSKLAASEDWASLRSVIRSCLRLSALVTIPITIVFVAMAPLIIRLLFQRGQFTSADTAIVSQVLRCFALQIPFYVAGTVVVRAIAALRMNHILAVASAINLVTNCVLNYVLMQRMGVAGIALSTSIVYLLSFSFCYFMLQRVMQR